MQMQDCGDASSASLINIRKAEEQDITAMMEIYNYEVEHGVATLDLHPRSYEDRKAWFCMHRSEDHPLIVAEESGVILGYASLSPYREKEAYRSTVELSIYIAPEHRKKGIATKLMQAILKMAGKNAQIHLVVSVITRGNEASNRLHQKFGFTYCGTLHEVGMKFGKYLDIDNYELVV